MKQKIPYQNFSSFVLRTPFLPYTFLNSLISGKTTDENKLKEICEKKYIHEAIFLASPNLHDKLLKWLNNKLTDKKEIERLKYSLMKYIIRMSSRPTPFGLFAGCSVGHFKEETNIELQKKENFTRHTRLDMNYLCALAQDLAKHPVIKKNIKFYPNSSIYTSGNNLRYVEYRYTEKSKRTHHIVSVDNSEYLQRIIAVAKNGAYINDLAKLLVDDEISFDESKAFIEELINSQILVNELEPAITGPEFLDQILSVLENIKDIDNIKNTLLKTKKSLQEIDNSPIGIPVSKYYQITENLKTLGTGFELKYMFQTDMITSTDNCYIDERIANDVLKGIEVMNKLSLKPSETNLSKFRDAFYERYEDKEVSLLDALDSESGIGYIQNITGDVNPLVDDIILPGSNESSYDIKWNKIQSFLFNKYNKAISENKYEIELTDNDLSKFIVEEAKWDDLPDTIYTMAQIVAGKNDNNQKEKIYISSAVGSSAANLLGRFCHADKKIDEYFKEITAKEEEINQNVILAEIVHLPESRTGNILFRPVFREYEIPYLSRSSVNEDYQIKLEDIILSIKGNRIILRSKRLNKEIIPRLSNAHNFFFNALPIYQFLCDMQTQNLRFGIGFNWGALDYEYSFFPRVSYKNLIFSLATWNIKKDDIKDILKIMDDDKLYKAVQEWRKQNKIPSNVLLADVYNELYINLENILCIKTLFSLIKNRPSFKLIEFLFDPKNTIVKNKEGVFINQIVLSFYKRNHVK